MKEMNEIIDQIMIRHTGRSNLNWTYLFDYFACGQMSVHLNHCTSDHMFNETIYESQTDLS